MKKFFNSIILVFGILFLAPLGAAALGAKVYVESPQKIAVGSEFPLTIFLDSDVPLNAYSFEVYYSPNLLPTTFDWRNSIVELRPDQPRMIEAGKISFEGGSFKSFSGNKGRILTLNFKALKEGEARLGFAKAEAFLADGKGTKILLEPQGLEVSLLPERLYAENESVYSGEKLATSDESDKTPPELKEVSFEADPINSEQKLLGFIAADSGSGVRTVEARIRTLFSWGEWTPVTNPVAVSRDVWSLALLVTDSAGNTVEQTFYDWRAFGLMMLYPIVAAVIAFLFIAMLRRRRIKQNIV